MADAARRREILELVALGEVTPEEAAELLARLDTADGGPASADAAGAGQSPGPSAAGPTPIRTAAAARRTGAAGTAAPTDPADPAAAAGPGAPGQPDRPTQPAQPVQAAQPAQPAEPAAPAQPAAAAEPAPPHQPAADPAAADPQPDPAQRPDLNDDAVTTVHIRSTCRAVSIVGDEDVLTAVAEGDHTAHIDGHTITIEANLDRPPGFTFIRTPGSPGMRVKSRAKVRIGGDAIRPLLVRMNPDLALVSHVDAGSITVRGVHGPIRAHTSAGALRIDDFDAPIDLKVAAGSASARGRLAGGASKVECDAGKVTIRLTSDSSVKVKGHVTLGQLSAPDLVGDGAGTLDIVTNLGSVDVAVEDDA